MSSRTILSTQEDPIGLAGGLNLYGFAGGDPINFADPFGLNPLALCAPNPAACALVVQRAYRMLRTALSAYQAAQSVDRRQQDSQEDLGAERETDRAVGKVEGSGRVNTTGSGKKNVDRRGEGTSAEGALEELAGDLGTASRPTKDGKGRIVDLPDGGTASSRPTSSDGSPTVQVNRPNRPTTKVRFDNP